MKFIIQPPPIYIAPFDLFELSSRQIEAALACRFKKNDSFFINKIHLDSRKIYNGQNALFVAIKGPIHQGHHFIEEAYKKGIRHFIIQDPSYTQLLNGIDANYIVVDNSILALQKLASDSRKNFTGKVIGITGSNGKTWVKEWLHQLLLGTLKTQRSPRSYNSQVGVPLSVIPLSNKHDIGIFEAGISKKGEMARLEKIIQPNIGIFTNLGSAHQENFSNLEEKLNEKLILFQHASLIIFNADKEMVAKAIDQKFSPEKQWGWSFSKKKSNRIYCQYNKKEKRIRIPYKKDFIDFSVPVGNEIAIENLIHCVLACSALGINKELIFDKISTLKPIGMRMENIIGQNNCLLINDTYTSDLESLEIGLDSILEDKRKKVLIVSDFLETAGSNSFKNKKVLEMITERSISKIIWIGTQFMPELWKNKNLQCVHYPDTDVFLKSHAPLEFKDEIILVKGARKFRFEQIIDRLQLQNHQTVLEINLENLKSNLEYFKSKIGEGTKIMAMVKASSYGAGSLEIAKHLQYNGINYLGVAYNDEGILLRKSGIGIPIMVMNPENDFKRLISYQLEPEIYSVSQLNGFIEHLQQSWDEVSLPYPLHLKLDTGMHRLGVEEKDLKKCISILYENQNLVRVVSVFTHLASSEDESEDWFTELQLEKFEKYGLQLKAKLPYFFDRHALNSAGVLRFTHHKYEMVRLGIGLYGPDILSNHHAELKTVFSLKSSITQIKNLKKGESVGYNRQEILKKDTPIGIIPIGYADGLNRKLGNRNQWVIIGNKKADIIGNVCMDMIMVDLSHTNAKEGDTVIILGDNPNIYDWAKKTESIAYEILTSFSPRLKRVYIY